jgi:hypothetical protein
MSVPCEVASFLRTKSYAHLVLKIFGVKARGCEKKKKNHVKNNAWKTTRSIDRCRAPFFLFHKTSSNQPTINNYNCEIISVLYVVSLLLTQTTTNTMSSVLEKARSSGKYPPSLLGEYIGNDDGFETALLKILDANGTFVEGSVCLSYREKST